MAPRNKPKPAHVIPFVTLGDPRKHLDPVTGDFDIKAMEKETAEVNRRNQVISNAVGMIRSGLGPSRTGPAQPRKKGTAEKQRAQKREERMVPDKPKPKQHTMTLTPLPGKPPPGMSMSRFLKLIQNPPHGVSMKQWLETIKAGPA